MKKYYGISFISISTIPEVLQKACGGWRLDKETNSIYLQNIKAYVRYPNWIPNQQTFRKEFPIICEYLGTEEKTNRKKFVDVITGKEFYTLPDNGTTIFDEMAIEIGKKIPKKEVKRKLKELTKSDIDIYTKALNRLEERIKEGYQKYLERAHLNNNQTGVKILKRKKDE